MNKLILVLSLTMVVAGAGRTVTASQSQSTVADSLEIGLTLSVSAEHGQFYPGVWVLYTATFVPLADRDVLLTVQAAPGLQWARVRNWTGCATEFRVTDERSLEVIVAKAHGAKGVYTISWGSLLDPRTVPGTSVDQVVRAVASPDQRPLESVPTEERLAAEASCSFPVVKKSEGQ